MTNKQQKAAPQIAIARLLALHAKAHQKHGATGGLKAMGARAVALGLLADAGQSKTERLDALLSLSPQDFAALESSINGDP
jgi:hypothetical protein